MNAFEDPTTAEKIGLMLVVLAVFLTLVFVWVWAIVGLPGPIVGASAFTLSLMLCLGVAVGES